MAVVMFMMRPVVMVASWPMHVLVAVIMFVSMVMMVIVVVSTVVSRMSMIMRMSTMGMIGSARRLEGLVDIEDGGAEPLQHRADNVIAQDNDAVFLDLGREMTVAEMPG